MQVQHLIAELNEILAHDIIDEAGAWKKKLTSESVHLFDLLPLAIQEQLLLERDPHGNVQVHALALKFLDPCGSLVMCCCLIFVYSIYTFRLLKLKLRKCLSKWLKLSWR